MMILIDGFPYDTTTAESHERPSETTKYPVESGSDMTDHVRVLNNVIVMTVIVSDTPLADIELLRGLEDDDEPMKPSEEAEARLVKLRDERRHTTIVTAGGVYENVVMTAFTKKKGPEFQGGLFFDCTFEQNRIITNERTTIRVAEPRIQRKRDKGPQPTKTSNLVDRKVNCNTSRSGGCAWFDPDVKAWRMGASFDKKAGHWRYFKGALEHDGFQGSDEQIRKHLHDSSPATGGDAGFTIVDSMDGKSKNVVLNPGQSLVLDPTQSEWAAVDAGQPLPVPSAPSPPESLLP